MSQSRRVAGFIALALLVVTLNFAVGYVYHAITGNYLVGKNTEYQPKDGKVCMIYPHICVGGGK